MSKAKQGDKVRVHYTGRKKTDGEVFDSSEGREPLEFTIGAHQVIPDFEECVIGLSAGEKTTVEAPCDRAYGRHVDERVIDFPKERFPKDMTINIGDQLYLMDKNGNPVPVKVTAIGEDTVTLDANHMLAGEDLIFDVELVEIL